MTMRKIQKTRRMRFNIFEKVLYTTGFLCLIGLFITKIFIGTKVSNMKMNIEKINYKINTQEKKNESLTMQINELTSYENVSGVIKNMGLAYNDENIIIIDK